MAFETIVAEATLAFISDFPCISIDIFHVICSIDFSNLMGTAENKSKL